MSRRWSGLIYIAMIMSILAIIFFINYFLQKHQIKLLKQQLQSGQDRKNYQKVYYSSKDKSLEQLASQINDLIQYKKDIQAAGIRKEIDIKDAIASMSHDLRTPLTSIIGYLQLLEKADLPQQEQKYVLAALRRAQHLEKLINNFFSLSAIDSVDDTLSITRIDLREVVQEVIFTFYDNFQEISIEPQFMFPDNRVDIIADQAATYRVIENIVLNALQHMTLNSLSNEANFSVDLVTEEQWATLSITNTFSNRNLAEEKVFQRFYTEDSSRRNNGGLGLAIVKSLMEKMAGKVDVIIKDD